MSRFFVIYAGMGPATDTDEATVLDTAESLHEAKEVVRSYGGGAAAFSYEQQWNPTTQSTELVDERWEC